MAQLRGLPALAMTMTVCTLVLAGMSVRAAPITINGASFDAPPSCQLAESALVCKEGDQQLELWVYCKPLGANISAVASFVRKLSYMNDLHETAVSNIKRSTNNTDPTPFSMYGSYSAVGSAMAGKGAVTSPSIRFASVFHDEQIWQFMEVVAVRTPAIEAISSALQNSLSLPAPVSASGTAAGPAAANAPASEPPKKTEGSPMVVHFSSELVQFDHPGYLSPTVALDKADRLNVSFKHKTRASGGPTLTLTLVPRRESTKKASVLAAEKRTALAETMTGQTASVDISKLGAISGSGFALVGVPDVKKGLSGVETIETNFVSDLDDYVLEVRLVAEQQYSSDARAVWLMLAGSLKFEK